MELSQQLVWNLWARKFRSRPISKLAGETLKAAAGLGGLNRVPGAMLGPTHIQTRKITF